MPDDLNTPPESEPPDEVPIKPDATEIEDDHGVGEGLLELYTALEAEEAGMLP